MTILQIFPSLKLQLKVGMPEAFISKTVHNLVFPSLVFRLPWTVRKKSKVKPSFDNSPNFSFFKSTAVGGHAWGIGLEDRAQSSFSFLCFVLALRPSQFMPNQILFFLLYFSQVFPSLCRYILVKTYTFLWRA